MQIIVQINSCAECRHRDHSGAFTPGGSRPICGHSKAVKTFTQFKTFKPGKEDDKWHWRHRVLDMKKIPGKCPLVLGYLY